MMKNLTIQDYITLGYLYLVLLGVINIVIYYSAFNINIFDYIAITDILLAPINMLFLDYLNTVKIILVIGFFCYLLKFLFIIINRLIKNASIKFNKLLSTVTYQPLIIFVTLFSYIFLDLSIGMAERVSLQIKSKAHKPETTITFTDNTQKNVSVIATTSVYLFYVEKGEDVVIVAPISGNVKSIKGIL